MTITKIIQGVENGAINSKLIKAVNAVSTRAGSKFEKSPVADFFNKYIEPVGSNNKFPVIAGFMIFVAIIPRILTAANRNPDDKEATKDEIKEILFRDIQTVGILLFLLKTLNAVIAGKVTDKTGIPMTNKPFEKLFNDNMKAYDKAKDFISHPVQKTKIIVKNVIDAFNPMGGVCAKTNKEHIADYSNYKFEQLPAFFEKISAEKGDSTKVFNKIIDGTIEEYQKILYGSDKKGVACGINDFLKIAVDKNGAEAKNFIQAKANIQATIQDLQALKQKGVSAIIDETTENVKKAISNYMADENNSLVKSAKGLNGWLKTGALAFEMTYLGFGIPALNQVRLEKKYLKNKNNEAGQFIDINTITPATNKKYNENHVKLYHNFIK